MLAVQIQTYGPVEQGVVVNTINIPQIDEESDQVLVKVYSASINPIDCKLASGYLRAFMPIETPYTTGFDVSGVVVRTGKKCTRIQVGQEVFADAARAGTFAEYVVAKECVFVEKPRNLNHHQSASVPLAALTAYQSLVTHGNFEYGDRVLIFGGSGGCGIAAIQIAKAFGASNITTTSTSVDLLLSLGADRVINYREQNWMEELKDEKFDVIFDCVGEENTFENSQNLLTQDGKFVCIVTKSKGITSPQWKHVFTDSSKSDPDLIIIKNLIEENKFIPIIDEAENYNFNNPISIFFKIKFITYKRKISF